MGKILCVGEALIDMICTDKGSSLADGDNFLKKPGGAPTNVAAAIAALGGEAALAAKVGADPFGKHLIDVMQNFGVSTQHVIEDEKHFTTFAFVSLLQSGERDFYFNRGADAAYTHEEADEINLDDYSIVHFGSATAFLPGTLQTAYQSLYQKAKKQNRFISFDPNYRKLLFQHNHQSFIEQSWNFLTGCHFFKVSDEEALLITGRDNIEDAAADFIAKTNAVFTITLGKDGTLLGLGGKTTIIPSITIQAVDTTGAGDAFVGAVLYQLSKNPQPALQDWHKIITNGNKAGARTCEYLGAMEAFKHLNTDIFN